MPLTTTADAATNSTDNNDNKYFSDKAEVSALIVNKRIEVSTIVTFQNNSQ